MSRERNREKARESERKTDERKKEREREKERQRATRNRHGVDIVATNVTAATVSKLGVTSSRQPNPPKKWESKRERQKERER